MICPTCRTAADNRLAAEQHCSDPKCMCGHRADRYRAVTGFDVLAIQYARLAQIADQTTEVHRRIAVRPVGEPFRFPPMISYLADGEEPDDVPTVIPADIMRLFRSRADDAQAHAAAVEAAIAKNACTATLDNAWTCGTIRCRGAAGHYDAEQLPDGNAAGGWHHGEVVIWADEEHGATPHTDTTPENRP